MNNIYLVAGVVSLIFFIFKFIEMRFITKENKSLKQVIIDTIIVFVSSILSYLIVEKLDLKTKELNQAPAFTDGPGF
jgi:hypothetical protein